MIYCGICRTNHTPAEWKACLDRQSKPKGK